MQVGYTCKSDTPNSRVVAMTTEKEREGMLETLYLLRSPANAERPLRSIDSADAGRLTEHELIKARPDAK